MSGYSNIQIPVADSSDPTVDGSHPDCLDDLDDLDDLGVPGIQSLNRHRHENLGLNRPMDPDHTRKDQSF